MSESEFDPIRYWKERHLRFRGDVRSVGNLGKSIEENTKGTSAILRTLKELIPRLFKSTTGLTALDLACGIGRFAPVLTEMGFAYTGVDVSPEALKQAKQSCPSGVFIEADVCSIHPETKYDLILSLYFLVHVIDDSRWGDALDIVVESISPRGVFILMDNIPSTRQQPARHVVERSMREYETALAERGLAIRKTEFSRTYIVTPSRG